MKYIAHRGNLLGPDKDTENTVEQIEKCISKGYDVEIDLYFQNDWFLGHDGPQYRIDISFLLEHRNFLWCHCKNSDALFRIQEYNLNYFWHDNDDFTLTSYNYIWTFPGKKLYKNSIVVKPENYTTDKNFNCAGICSDYIEHFRYSLSCS